MRCWSSPKRPKACCPRNLTPSDRDGALIEAELIESHARVADRLPNLAVPEMNSVGAMEICVSTAAGVCDFISAMDTSRVAEWNMWYHILNCGFPLKVSGETDFPCMSGDRVGQGRVYVNGKPVASKEVPADGQVHDLDFEVRVERSSWLALRHFPQLHTNPVNVLVAGHPIRTSRSSALWCIETINQVWRMKHEKIPDEERSAARAAFDEAIAKYRRIASEAPEGS